MILNIRSTWKAVFSNLSFSLFQHQTHVSANFGTLQLVLKWSLHSLLSVWLKIFLKNCDFGYICQHELCDTKLLWGTILNDFPMREKNQLFYRRNVSVFLKFYFVKLGILCVMGGERGWMRDIPFNQFLQDISGEK